MQKLERHDLQWCLRRAPKIVLELMKRQGPTVVVAGGYIRACIARETVNDIDLFCPTKELAEALAIELAGGKEKMHTTDNAYTIRSASRVPIQFIHRWTYPTPESLLSSFDFTVACAAFWWDGTQWQSLCHNRFYADLAGKRLHYLAPNRNEDAGGSILRVLKFYQKEYRIPVDSLGAVIARLMRDVDLERLPERRELGLEGAIAKVVTGLLREVDPDIDPTHIAHLPSENTENEQEDQAATV